LSGLIRAFLAEAPGRIGGGPVCAAAGIVADVSGDSALQGLMAPDARSGAKWESATLARRRLRGSARLAASSFGVIAAKSSAHAADAVTVDVDFSVLFLLLLLLFFCLLTAALHLLARNHWKRRERLLAEDLERTRAELDRANLFLVSEPQIIVAWDRPDRAPRIEGDVSLVGETSAPGRTLAFGCWLAPDFAAKAEDSVAKLLNRGEAFSIDVAGLDGRHFEIAGRAVAGYAVMRIREITGDRLQLVRLHERHTESVAELEGLRRLLEASSNPAWTRDREGFVIWANPAYACAVEAVDAFAAVDRHLELFDRVVQGEAASARASAGLWRSRAPAIVAGERKIFDVLEVLTETGTAGMACDHSEIESLRAEMERHIGAYKGMLDQLSTAVAIFDRAKRLIFYNAAYRQVWSLDPAFLEQQPTDGEILDRLRAKRQLPEQADFRGWKAERLAAYTAIEPSEAVWHLPDGRALRVVTSPNPQGGVTYLFDDATQSFALASQLNALTRVQGETLDALKEGVAVFGADGRMKLVNPAFAKLWRFDPARASARPHIDEVARDCLPLLADLSIWDGLRATVVGLTEDRRPVEGRIERKDGLVLDCASLPLPDGATLITFFDATASANVERALTERNEALVSAEKLRNDFVNHVSYELRTPLTNIIGFTQLLADGGAGPLNPKQIEYSSYIKSSSAALLAIINDILDLASIDAGALELRPEEVDVVEAMKAAAEGVQDRLSESHIDLRIVATDGVGILRADGRRVRQVLFNLLANAIGFSEAGQTVILAAMRRGDEVVFKVSDRGRGIAPEALDRIFDRFESQTSGSRHRGPGLGLSIVRPLVELHGGRVTVDSALGEGTTVTCIFPVRAARGLASAVA
jgi:signal transduction histidine kinase